MFRYSSLESLSIQSGSSSRLWQIGNLTDQDVSNHEAENKILVVIGVCDNQIGSKIEAYATCQRILEVYAVHGSLPCLGIEEHLGLQKMWEAHKG